MDVFSTFIFPSFILGLIVGIGFMYWLNIPTEKRKRKAIEKFEKEINKDIDAALKLNIKGKGVWRHPRLGLELKQRRQK